MNNAQTLLFGKSLGINLAKELRSYEIPLGLVRCRVLYVQSIEVVEFFPYQPRRINSLKLVYDDSIDYSLKYNNRDTLNRLVQMKGNCDEILIVKNGYITDTSYTNICFYDGTHWHTPSAPLLKGTKREQLIEKGIIIEAEIKPDDLLKYSNAMLINAMLDFDEKNGVVIDVNSIFR